ncbi:MAG: translocation/assembly module TamB domain-containing protein [Bacteroidales bacterium]|nr:translocation/assembly module TamB domain-containing protein [Bacteroidales bacterium]
MKKGLRITLWILAAILILLLALVVAIQSPRVQTALARKVVSRVSGQIDGDISVGLIAVRPFDAVTLEDVVITDRNPYAGGEFPRQDTLVRIGSLSGRFSLKGLLHKERISVSRLKLKDAEFNLVIEPGTGAKGTTDNLSRVFRLKSDPDKPKKDFGDLLEASKVDIEDFTFRMFNHPAAARSQERGHAPLPEDVINWNDLEIKADIHASDLLVKDGVISGDADHIAIRDKTGWDVRDLSGKVKVGHGKVLLDNLHIDDGDSDIHLRYFRLLGTLSEDYKDFIGRVRMEGEFVSPTVFSMQTVRHFAPNLERFTFRSDLTGKLEGTVSDFNLKGIGIRDYGSGVQGRIDGSMRGLPDIRNTVLDYRVKDFRFGLGGLGTFIQEWAPDTRLDLGKLAKGTDFSLDATAKGTLDRLAVKGDLNSNAGAADLDITLRNILDRKRNITIGGLVRTRDLDAGRIAGIKELGPVTLTTGVEAVLAPRNLQVRIDSLQVRRLRALGYDYTGIAAAGTYSDQAFDGRLVCDDPNLNALIQGKFDLSPSTRNSAYQFYANIGYADLNALNIDKRGTSKVSLQADANFIRTRDRDLLGDVFLRDIVLENENGRHPIGDITASAHANDDIHRMRLESGFAQGTFVGDKSFLAMVSDLKDLLVRKELPSLLAKPGAPWDGTPYELNFKFFDTREVLGYLLPGLYIERNTALQLKVGEDGSVDGNVSSGRLAFGNRYLKDFRLDFDNRNNALYADISGSALNLGGVELRDNRIALMVDDDRFDMTYTFDNRSEEDSRGDVRLMGDLSRDGDGLSVTASVLPSSIYYDGNRWNVDSDDVTIKGGDIQVDRFRIRSGRQSLVVDGGLSPGKTDTLLVRMDQFDISLANSFLMQGKMDLKGRATGQASLISPSKPTLSLLAGITCDSTYLAGRPMGTLEVASVWNEPEKRFDFQLQNLLDEVRNFAIDGYLRPSDKALRADAVLARLDLGYAAPFLESVFDRFEGALDGKLSVGGTLDKLQIGSEGMQLVDGILGVEFTQVPYQVSGPVSVDTEGLHFQDVSLADGYGGKGSVTGSLLFGGFKDMRMDTHIQFDRMKVLGITNRNSPIYGDVYGTGRVDITGPFDALALTVDARTVKDGNLHIPLRSGGTQATGDLLVFKQPYVEVEEDPYEQMMLASRTDKKKKSQGNLDIRVRVRATPAVTAYIDIGENALQGIGNGMIDLRIRSGQSNLFTINGDYTLSQGEFRFSTLELVSREFSIRDGSSIRFNGDVMDSDLNVTGVYTTKASLSTLLSSSASADAARRQVDCIIGITGKLRNPVIEFDIEIPELDPGTEGMVSSALNTESKKMKQFLYLLIANSFLPNEESGIITTGGSNMLYSNMSGIMAGQLNSIFQALNIPLDLGLNYQQNASGQNLFDVALSTQLFNNRVVVNGNIGNRRVLGTTTDEVAGDVDIDIKLDKPGTFRLNLFSHSADQYTSFLDNSQRNGIGFAYQREFNSVRQFFRQLFTPRREREAQEAMQPVERTFLQIDTAGKAHPLIPHE